MAIHQKILDYFEGIAASHKEINHSDRNPRFSTMLNTHFTNVAENADDIILQVYDITGTLITSNVILPSPNLGFLVWVGFERDNNLSEQKAFDKSFEVGTQILAKILYDQDQGCAPFNGFKPSQVRWAQVDQQAHNFNAYLFQFPILGEAVDYNPELWQ